MDRVKKALERLMKRKRHDLPEDVKEEVRDVQHAPVKKIEQGEELASKKVAQRVKYQRKAEARGEWDARKR